MYRKLMFLISFVALLGLVNVLEADDWDGGGADRSWCTPENWKDDTVPGPDDGVTLEPVDDPNTAWNDPLIDCDADFGNLEGPCWDCSADQSQTLDIVSANVRFKEGIEGGRGTEVINISGASNVDCWNARWRMANHGKVTLNISEDSIIHVNGDLRGGDESDGIFNINMSGGTLVVEGEILVGDDGSGVFTFTGGDVTCRRFTVAARQGSPHQTPEMVVSGDTEIFIGGGDDPEFRIGKDCKNDGGLGTLTMTGGIVNAENIVLSASEGACADVSVNMQGGLLIAREDFIVADGDGAVTVSISGGEIHILGDSLEIGENGSIDITGGVLILAGNKAAEIGKLVCVDGVITGYGSPQGVVIDYGVTNPGKTTVTAEIADECQAFCPVPADGADKVQSVITPVELCWASGLCIGTRGRHGIYFADDYEAVRDANSNANIPPGQGYQRASLTCWNAGNLPLWTTYYWRIDENNEDASYTKGLVWSFTTGCEDIVGDINKDCLLNFEDYASIAGTWQQEQLWP